MSGEDIRESIGVRIARVRKRRGLTQHGLAQRASYSRSHLAQVEAGHKVATPAFAAAVAAALGVDVAELYGQPFRASTGREDQVHAAIPELRKVLAYVDVGPDLAGPPRTLDQLAAEVATARRLLLQARLAQLGARLPAVLEELTYHAHETDSPRAWALLNRAHASAVSFARRLGYTGDALALLDRAADAARRSQDPHLPLLVALPRSLLLMNMSQNKPALTLLTRAADNVQDDRVDAGEVAGALSLRAAIVAGRAGDAGQAWEFFGRAAEMVEAGRAGPPVHSVQFNAANVAIHGAAVAVELGDLDEAARRDHQISEKTINGLVPERRAHHEIDMSRVHVETGDYNKALERLLSAERTAPQMTRFHPSARAVVSHLVDVRRTLPEPLRRLHTRMSA
ncbi:helix-turn-helix domain-containing protein [Actinomadura alba]|uniref:Helix-turn-helix transcriptional regulator n=1 Tax=Actinomadura alba TaxID=406431 RepID=A0ABR7LRP4_9ACTN|nr:helix-turn-helix transcriptional regulator [Actinomadura alba]MBC6467509.1 helix-turn-helix transcriptional regulator [Actinomadura alba]